MTLPPMIGQNGSLDPASQTKYQQLLSVIEEMSKDIEQKWKAIKEKWEVTSKELKERKELSSASRSFAERSNSASLDVIRQSALDAP